MTGPIPFFEALRNDLRAHVPPTDRFGSSAKVLSRTCVLILTSAGFHLTLLYRLSHTSRYRLGLPGRALAAWFYWLGRHVYGCSMAPTALLGGGLILPHPQGIVIGAGAVVGPRAWIFQNVTIGGVPDRSGLPTIGADARIYAGAVVSGPIAVGDNVVIGANAVVGRDVPPRSMVRSLAVEVAPLPEKFVVEL